VLGEEEEDNLLFERSLKIPRSSSSEISPTLEIIDHDDYNTTTATTSDMKEEIKEAGELGFLEL